MRRFVYIFLSGLFLFPSCGGKNGDKEEVSLAEVIEDTREEDSQYITATESAPGNVRRIKVKNLGSLAMLFNDSNYLQLGVAQKIGLKPIEDVSSAYFTNRPIVKIEDNENYKVDSLTHSLPFLVPEAAYLLDEIGKTFRDSLAARGGDNHLIKVTSLLRTPESVGRLRRVNINATDSSTHQYGTTFDISYTNFWVTDSSRLVHQGDLKNLLAEVLENFREQGRCYVKFERKTGCFHVTVIK